MIGYLSGSIISLGDQAILLEVNGVGYEIFLGNVRAIAPGEIGAKAALWIHTYVREDQITLFGFKDTTTKKVFTILIGVSGIGPKLAMSVIASLSSAELVDAVTMGNTRVLQGVSGVGKKMAERLVVELKDKLAGLVKEAGWSETTGGAEIAVWRDLSDALAGLGFPEQKVRNVIHLIKPDFEGKSLEINQLLKLALQKIKNC